MGVVYIHGVPVNTSSNYMDITPKEVDQLEDGSWSAQISQVIGVTGTQIYNGVLYTDINPNLQPFQIRGVNGQPGLYDQLANHFAYHAVERRRINSIKASTYRLDPYKLDEYQRQDPLAVYLADLQHEYCCRILSLLRRGGMRSVTGNNKGLEDWFEEVARNVPKKGFGIWEITAQERRMTFSNGMTRTVWYPDLPRFRAQNSVLQWIRQDGELLGVLLDTGIQIEADGTQRDTRTVLPWFKMLRVAQFDDGDNYEGVSDLRCVVNLIKKNWETEEKERLAVARRVKSQTFFVQESDIMKGSAAKDDIDKMNEFTEAEFQGKDTAGFPTPVGYKPIRLKEETPFPDTGSLKRDQIRDILMGLGAEDRQIGANGTGAFAARDRAASDAAVEKHSVYDSITKGLQTLLTRMIVLSGLHLGQEEYVFCPTPEFETSTPEMKAAEMRLFVEAIRDEVLQPREGDEDYIRSGLNAPLAEAKM